MKTYQEFITESVKVNKSTSKMIEDINHLYSIDLAPHINIGNKRDWFSFHADDLDDNQIRNIERFSNDKGLRFEKSGHKQYAIYFKK